MAAAPETAPDLIGAVAGFRSWTLRAPEAAAKEPVAGSLHPGWTNSDNPWPPGDFKARCEAHAVSLYDKPPHTAPDADCACGIYAVHELSSVPSSPRPPPWDARNVEVCLPVTGVIRAWGDIEVHWEGFRAEFAEVFAFAPREADVPRGVDWVLPILRLTAEKYGAELVPFDQLPDAARRAGGIVPKELRPEGRFWIEAEVSFVVAGDYTMEAYEGWLAEAKAAGIRYEGHEVSVEPEEIPIVGSYRRVFRPPAARSVTVAFSATGRGLPREACQKVSQDLSGIKAIFPDASIRLAVRPSRP